MQKLKKSKSTIIELVCLFHVFSLRKRIVFSEQYTGLLTCKTMLFKTLLQAIDQTKRFMNTFMPLIRI